jgi:hypothetical protein
MKPMFRQFNADLMRVVTGAVWVTTPNTIEDESRGAAPRV